MSNSKTNDLKRILSKYKFEKPVPDPVRSHVIDTQRKSFISLLKKHKKHGKIISLILLIFFGLRKLGIHISFFQSAVITTVVTTITAATVTTASVVAVKKVIEKINLPELEITEPDKTSRINDNELIIKLNPKPKKITAPVTSYKSTIAIQQFDSKNVDNKIKKLVLDIITNELRILKGPDVLIKSGIKSDNRLIGSIENFNDSYIVSVKIINLKSGKVLYLNSGDSKSLEGLKTVCKNIAKEISIKVKL